MRGHVIDALLFVSDRLRVAVLSIALLGLLQTAVAVWARADHPSRNPESTLRIGLRS